MSEAGRAAAPGTIQLGLIWRRLRGGALSPLRAGLSVALGLFIGALPVYGFQLLLILAVCIPFRLDAAVAYVAAHISNPLTLPLLILAEIEVGALALTGRHAELVAPANLENLGNYGVQLAVGAPLLGAVMAAVGGMGTLLLAERRSKEDPVQAATERVLQRYSAASRGQRVYARAKLELDPLPRSLVKLDQHLGHVIDAGCGLGQLGLFLLETGVAESLTAFDPSEDSTRVARQTGTAANFTTASFSDFQWQPADTIIFADTLHYVELSVQNATLTRAAASLRPGGRLVIREVEARPGWRSALTRLSERISASLRGRRSSHAYRSSEELSAFLESLGLEVQRLARSDSDPFDNQVLIAVVTSDRSSYSRAE